MNIYKLVVLMLLILTAAVPVIAQNHEYFDKYSDVIPGEKDDFMLAVLDTMYFQYYGENYSVRVMGVYETSAMIRIGKKAVDILSGESMDFDLDSDEVDDINVKIIFVGEDAAKLELELFVNPDKELIPTPTNNTNLNMFNSLMNESNTTQSNSTVLNVSQTLTNNSANSNQNNAIVIQNNTTLNNEISNETPQDNDSPTGSSIINININFSPGSALGILIIIAIVLGGLITYKVFRKMLFS